MNVLVVDALFDCNNYFIYFYAVNYLHGVGEVVWCGMAEKNMGGRPTKYKPEYDKMLIEHMATGMSFESFAGVIRVDETTIFEWDKVHESFSQSKRQAFALNRVFWDRAAVESATKAYEGHPTTLIFNLKNRFPKQWRDRTEQHIEAKVETNSAELTDLSNKVKSLLNDIKNRKS